MWAEGLSPCDVWRRCQSVVLLSLTIWWNLEVGGGGVRGTRRRKTAMADGVSL